YSFEVCLHRSQMRGSIHANGVAVRVGRLDKGHLGGAAATCSVDYHYRFAKNLASSVRQFPGKNVGGRTSPCMNDNGYRLVRKIIRCCPGAGSSNGCSQCNRYCKPMSSL